MHLPLVGTHPAKFGHTPGTDVRPQVLSGSSSGSEWHRSWKQMAVLQYRERAPPCHPKQGGGSSHLLRAAKGQAWSQGCKKGKWWEAIAGVPAKQSHWKARRVVIRSWDSQEAKINQQVGWAEEETKTPLASAFYNQKNLTPWVTELLRLRWEGARGVCSQPPATSPGARGFLRAVLKHLRREMSTFTACLSSREEGSPSTPGWFT